MPCRLFVIFWADGTLHIFFIQSQLITILHSAVCCPEGNMLVPLKWLLLVNFFYPKLRVSQPKQNAKQKGDPILSLAGSEIATKAEALVAGEAGAVTVAPIFRYLHYCWSRGLCNCCVMLTIAVQYHYQHPWDRDQALYSGSLSSAKHQTIMILGHPNSIIFLLFC